MRALITLNNLINPRFKDILNICIGYKIMYTLCILYQVHNIYEKISRGEDFNENLVYNFL